MVEVPMDAKIIMQQFWAEQKAREAQRGLRKENPKRIARLEAKLRKSRTVTDVINLANSRGVGVVNGGREGTYLKAPNGLRQPLSNHPGDLTPGMADAARGFIKQYGNSPTLAR